MSDKSKSLLARRIVLLCLSLVFAFTISFSVKFLVNLSSISSRNMRNTADITMRHLNLDIQNFLEPAMNLTNSVAAIINDIESFEDKELILENILATVPAAFEIFYGTTLSRFDGGYFATATDWDPYGNNPEWNQIIRPWFIFAMENPGRTVITDPYEDASTGKICVTIVRTVSNPSGHIVGVVGTDVFLDVLTEIVTSRTITSDGDTFIINHEGLYMVHHNENYVMNRNFFETEGLGLSLNFSYEPEVLILGDTYWVSMQKTGLDWIIVTTGSTEELNRDFQLLLTTTIIMGIVAFVVVVIISLLFSKILTRQIVRLFTILRAIAAGDFTQQFEAKGKDEISQMTMLLRETQESVKNMIINIKKDTIALSDISADLSNDMTETAAAMNEITSNLQNMKQRMINQSAGVTETNATMEQISVNINKLNDHVEKQTYSVAQSSSAIEQMLANIDSVTNTLVKNSTNVQALTGASDVGRTGMSEVAADIQEIARESEGLLEINTVMKSIASQTNLLSMNASIEAAHAGEAGKGFAVVAEEIRKLAESSSEQSKTISTVLKKIKSSIDKITVSTDNVLQKFEAIDSSVKTVTDQEDNIRNAMEEQGEGSKQILEAISLVNETTQMVKSSSLEMLEGSKEVIREVVILEKSTQEITGGMNEMANGAEQINTAVHHVNELSNRNRDNINLLMQELSKFKVE